MSDKMHPVSFQRMLKWISKEYKDQRSIFGIPEQKFVSYNENESVYLFGEKCDMPVGPAAGPHTQLAGNIIASYLAGSRFFELKTVQILDSLEFDKPCIEAEDEGYNTEWSTELSIQQAYKEYVKAWIILHLLKHLFDNSQLSEAGFIFNMSVGYDLKGISSPPVDNFIESLKDAIHNEFYAECISILKNSIPELFPDLNSSLADQISPHISNSITLCPYPETIISFHANSQ